MIEECWRYFKVGFHDGKIVNSEQRIVKHEALNEEIWNIFELEIFEFEFPHLHIRIHS